MLFRRMFRLKRMISPVNFFSDDAHEAMPTMIMLINIRKKTMILVGIAVKCKDLVSLSGHGAARKTRPSSYMHCSLAWMYAFQHGLLQTVCTRCKWKKGREKDKEEGRTKKEHGSRKKEAGNRNKESGIRRN